MATWKLTPDTGQTSGTNTDMPLVVIPSLLEMGSLTTAEADSVRFYSDASLTTELAREVVSADEIHVKVSSVSSSTEIWMDFDGVRSDYAATDTYGRNAVWSDYNLVWHGESATDSSGNQTLAGASGITIGGATGKIGDGTNFDGTNDNVDINSYIVGDDPTGISITLFVNPDSLSSLSYAHNQHESSATRYYDIGITSTPRIRFGVNANRFEATSGNLSTGSWQYIASTWLRSNGSTNLYLDASNVGSSTISESFNLSGGTLENVRIGARTNNGDQPFNGKIDELRVRPDEISSDWITTEYNNQNDNAAFWVASEAVDVRNAVFAFGGM